MADKPQTREERRKQLAEKKKKPTQKKSSKGMFKKIFLGLVIIGIIGLLAGVGTFAYMVSDAPKLDETMLKDPISSEIYDMNNELIRVVGSENRDYIEYEDIPDIVENAVIATEDVRFYKHNGLDPIRLVGAVIANVTDGFGSEGASTITQQVVKNYFLSFDKTIDRKAEEAWLSFQLEQKYTKEEIFEMYFNKIFMSENSHGIGTAAKIYFGKELKDIELHEAALLAGIPQSPNNYNPFTNPERAEKRRNIVLSLMHQHGFITAEEMKEAQDIPVTSTLVPEEEREKRKEKPYDAFVDRVIDEVEAQGDFDVFSDGLKIYTTLDPNAQTNVENALNTNEIVEFPNDEMQSGIVLLDTQTGEIRAIGGGRNREGERGWNYATDMKRQVGSTIKPILDYAPAIDYLNWGTYHMLEDKPYQYSNGEPISNWNNQYYGPMTMRSALAQSRNIPALQALQEVGLERARDFAENLGLGDSLPEQLTESAALGSYDLSPLEMAGAYAAFGNNGYYTDPHAVRKIVLRDNTEIDLSPESEVAMKDYTAYMITDMLKTAVQSGTGTEAAISNLQVAGKTGTTNYTDDQMRDWNIPDGAVPDSWFVGYTSRYTAAIWTGYEKRSKPLLADGYQQKIPQKLFKGIVSEISKNIDTPDFTQPDSVVQVAIEKGTMPAKLASDFTPKDQIIYELAVKGSSPTETSKRFEKLKAPSKLSANYDETANEIVLSWDYDKDKNVSFDVSASIDGGSDQLLKTTSDTALKVSSPDPGRTYAFKVVAIIGEKRSDAVTASVKIPDQETLPEEEVDEEENADQNEDGTEEDSGNGSGNNNGNDNGNGNGNGNEGSNGNGNGNDNGNGDNNGNGNNNGNENPNDPEENADDESETEETNAEPPSDEENE
ncbi:PBP1A family penicillin-binding protein [Mesobacillus maritimus]|uniref:transglycosylase domain-containing protein n=1 Tax=Mesobacillus maritimus TaxID=1643336 RepID=UPI00203A5370|nr:PBP1A family penicillin-binding protein [Mesobacillus maritimus]MCM3586538.1 PBP1A family penicillin-binding protein [Mesobacillus maritimus]MCM3669430.1 PBP1A family penicillin-binding protein [Mesobacillus maritimus]